MSRAPHAPEVGRLGRLLGAFHVTGVFWYRIHAFGVRIVPGPLRSPLIFVFASAFCVLLGRIRDSIGANLDAALGPAGRWRRQVRGARTMFRFAWSLTERWERLASNVAFSFEAEGEEHWRTAAAGERGFLLGTAHVGNWEIGSELPASRFSRRIHVVREAEMDPRAQRMLEAMLAKAMGDGYVTHFASSDPSLGKALLEAIDSGDVVALQMDRPRARGRTVTTRLFDRPFELPVGPFALARAAAVPILPVFVLREGRRRYRVVFRPPVEVERTGDRETDFAGAATRIADEIAAAIVRAPHQWFCFRRLWP